MKKQRKILRLLRKDKDWDFIFLIELEYYKLKQMYDYFSKNEVRYIICRDIKICLNLLKIYLEIDGIHILGDHSVNIKNANRFLSNVELDWLKGKAPKKFTFKTSSGKESSLPLDTFTMAKEELYKKKIWHLYNLIREYKLETWWD